MNTGFIKVAAVSPKVAVANVQKNLQTAMDVMQKAIQNKVQILVLPELYLTGYTCGDLFLQESLLNAALDALDALREATLDSDMLTCIGLPLRVNGRLYNCAAVLQNGEILGIVPKTYLPNTNAFSEKRWFCSADNANCAYARIGTVDVPFGNIMFRLSNRAILGVEIGEDLSAPVAPSTELALNGANIIANLSANNALVGKSEYIESIAAVQSAKCYCGYIVASANPLESTTDLVFSGDCAIYENGSCLAKSERFSWNGSFIIADIDIDTLNAERLKDTMFADNNAILRENDFEILDTPILELEKEDITRVYSPLPFIPKDDVLRRARCSEILTMQGIALAKRMQHTHQNKMILGISGGLDSTLALLVCSKAADILQLPYENILCVTMPGFGTTDQTYNNALDLIRELGAKLFEINIQSACLQHFKDIGHDADVHDVTYENTQARERTQILMDMGNQHGALLVGTGDLSELALGWCTYNADHMSMYGVNASVPKTLVRHIVACEADRLGGRLGMILKSILDTPVSPELLPPDKDGKIQQKTEDKLGPYEVHDFFLYHFLRFGTRPEKLKWMAVRAFDGKYTDEQIENWLRLFIRRFFISQFKRSCIPDGPKLGSVGLSPRGDLLMPSDAQWDTFLEF